jgi:hypothetical protein
MKPVMQEITTSAEGDCLSACLASLLELEIGQVPKFRRDHGPVEMMPAAREWLEETHGCSLVQVNLKKLPLEQLLAAPGQLCIAGVKVRHGLYHAVVGRLSGDGFELVHDPHPAVGGILEHPLALYFIVPVDPAGTNFG